MTDERDDDRLPAGADELLDDPRPGQVERGAGRTQEGELRGSREWLRFVDALDRLRFRHSTVTPWPPIASPTRHAPTRCVSRA